MGKDTWKDKPEWDAALLVSVQRHTNPDTGRKSWVKVTEELNDQLGQEFGKWTYRSRWQRLSGAVNATDMTKQSSGDPEAFLNAVKVMERPEAAKIMEDLVAPRFPDTPLPEFSWEEMYEVAERLADLSNKAQPTVTSATIHVPTNKPIAFMNTSDWHIGSRFMAYKTFRSLLDLTLSIPRLFWGVFGDEYDNFPLDWLPPAIMQVITPATQRQIVHGIVDKLIEKNKLLFSFWSNHPGFTERRTGENPMEPAYLGRIPYFHGKGVIRLKVGKEEDSAEEYVIYGAHQLKGNSIYNPTHPQMRALLWEVPSADFVIMGDKHQYAYSEVPHHDMSYLSGLHSNRTAHLLQVGTAKNGPDHYTIRGWSNGMFEWPIFILYPGEHKIKRVYDFEDLEHFLDVKIDRKLLRKLKASAKAEGGFST